MLSQKLKKNLEKFIKKKYNIKKIKNVVYKNGLIKFNEKLFKFNSVIKEAY